MLQRARLLADSAALLGAAIVVERRGRRERGCGQQLTAPSSWPPAHAQRRPAVEGTMALGSGLGVTSTAQQISCQQRILALYAPKATAAPTTTQPLHPTLRRFSSAAAVTANTGPPASPPSLARERPGVHTPSGEEGGGSEGAQAKEGSSPTLAQACSGEAPPSTASCGRGREQQRWWGNVEVRRASGRACSLPARHASKQRQTVPSHTGHVCTAATRLRQHRLAEGSVHVVDCGRHCRQRAGGSGKETRGQRRRWWCVTAGHACMGGDDAQPHKGTVPERCSHGAGLVHAPQPTASGGHPPVVSAALVPNWGSSSTRQSVVSRRCLRSTAARNT